MRTTQLTDLYQSEGPFASVTLDVSLGNESGPHELELRVRAACEELEEAGADEAVVKAVSERLGEPVTEAAPVGRVVVANASGVLLDQRMHTRVDDPQVAWGPLPRLSAWVEYEDGTTPFVLAVVDHEGGDVGVYTSDVPDPVEESSPGGETHHVHKVPTGGWSALRYQHTVENVWKRNAEAVVDEIVGQVRKGPRLVLLAGDPHSVAEVSAALEDGPAEVVHVKSGARSQDGGDDAMQQAIREALMEHTVARRLDMTHRLKDRLGTGEAVAVGVADVADAFVRGQVDTLLIDPAAAAEHTIAPADHPGLVLGPVEPGGDVPADQALIAAAALTGADVSVSRRATLGGSPVAALLRWDQPAEGTA